MPKEPIEITPDDSVVPVFLIELTDAEIKEKAKIDELLEEQKTNIKLEREAKLESALNKLKSLGLTESEAKIIIGLE